MFGSLLKAATVVVDVPVSVAADVITLCGATTGKEKPYTASAVDRFIENLENAVDLD